MPSRIIEVLGRRKLIVAAAVLIGGIAVAQTLYTAPASPPTESARPATAPVKPYPSSGYTITYSQDPPTSLPMNGQVAPAGTAGVRVRAIYPADKPENFRALITTADGVTQVYRPHDRLPDSDAEIVAMSSSGITLNSNGDISDVGTGTGDAGDSTAANSTHKDKDGKANAGTGDVSPYASCNSSNQAKADACYNEVSRYIESLWNNCDQYMDDEDESRWPTCYQLADRGQPY